MVSIFVLAQLWTSRQGVPERGVAIMYRKLLCHKYHIRCVKRDLEAGLIGEDVSMSTGFIFQVRDMVRKGGLNRAWRRHFGTAGSSQSRLGLGSYDYLLSSAGNTALPVHLSDYRYIPLLVLFIAPTLTAFRADKWRSHGSMYYRASCCWQ
jgi:hypothetical protein